MIHDHQSLLDDWFEAHCSLASEFSSNILQSIQKRHDEAAEYARRNGLVAPEIPSYYLPCFDLIENCEEVTE